MGDRDEDRMHIGNLSHGDIALLKNVSKETAKETVREFATAMGIDPDKPFEAQQDMQWVRSTRKMHQGIVGKIVMTAIGAGVLSFMSSAWAGFKTLVVAGSPPAH